MEPRPEKAGKYLVVIRAIGALLDAGVLFLITNLNANHRIHVQARQLSRLDDGHANLKVLSLQMMIELGEGSQSAIESK